MIFNADTQGKREQVARYLRSNINAPVVSVNISILGGVHRASAIITVGLDKKPWVNNIFENSRYFHMSLERNGELDQFRKSYKIPKKFRKARAKSLGDAVVKINKYIGQLK